MRLSTTRTPMAPAGLQIAFGEVRHTRLSPVVHAFNYPAFFIRVPIHRLDQLQSATRLFGLNRAAPLSFHESDHGDGRTPCQTWIRERLAESNLVADGPIWLDTFPRVFGYSFKPVSFWHCHNAAGQRIAVLAEVHNTFGERHGYLLHQRGEPLRGGAELSAGKAFHVSPFAAIEGRYRFRFHGRQDRWVARIDLDTAAGQALLRTSLSGTPEALDRASALRALLRYPLFTLGVIARIHAQAFALWRRRVPFFSKPIPPSTLITRSPS
jgi:DUF1365 family protein